MTQEKRSSPRTTSDTIEILSRRFIQGHPELEAMLVEEEEHLKIAEQIYALLPRPRSPRPGEPLDCGLAYKLHRLVER